MSQRQLGLREIGRLGRDSSECIRIAIAMRICYQTILLNEDAFEENANSDNNGSRGEIIVIFLAKQKRFESCFRERMIKKDGNFLWLVNPE